MERRTRFILVCLMLLLLFAGSYLFRHRVWMSPQQVLNEFYDYMYDGVEDQLMDPLILAGPKVVPLILSAIQNKDMPGRAYAMGALGNIRAERALESLERILRDPTEKDYFRCDALNAIALIDISHSRALAKEYQNDNSTCLSEMSHDLLSNNKPRWLRRRTYFEALISWHE